MAGGICRTCWRTGCWADDDLRSRPGRSVHDSRPDIDPGLLLKNFSLLDKPGAYYMIPQVEKV